MESLYYQINYFNEFGNEELTSEFLKKNVERLFFPINGILESTEFKSVYLKEVKSIFQMIDDIYENDLGIIRNLYIYMILNDMPNELIYFLKQKPNGPIVEENESYYWALPFYKDVDKNIPDSFFRIKVLLPQFIKIEKVILTDESFEIVDLSITKVFNVKVLKAVFQSRANINESHEFELSKTTDDKFSLNINLSTLKVSSSYDLFFYIIYDDKEDTIRMTTDMLLESDGLSNHNEFDLHKTKNNNLSLLSKRIEINYLKINNDKIDIMINELSNDEKQSIFVRDRISKEKFYFENMNEEHLELKWKHFLETNKTYDFFYEINKKAYRLSSENVNSVIKKTIKYDAMNISVYSTNKNNISLESMNNNRYKFRKIRGSIK